MTRVPELKQREDVAEDRRQIFDEIASSRGAVRGPFSVLLHSPELARRAASLGAYLRFESTLSPTVRETAVICTASVLDCDYEWAAHAAIARQVGVPEAVITAIKEHRPGDLPAEDRDLYTLADAILVTHRVPQELFDRLQARLGVESLVEVVAAVGYYSLIGATLNTFEVLPEAH